MPLSEIHVDAGALRHNVSALRTLLPRGTQLAAVVKANAYGHGLSQVVSALEDHVDAWQVDDLDELESLRQLSRKRTLVLGYVPKSDLAQAVALDAELTVYDFERIRALPAGARVHLKIDNLLGRQGVLPDQVSAYLDAIAEAGLDLVGVYGHFANIEDTTDLSHAHAQIEAFESAFAEAQRRFPNVGRHLSATSGLMTVEQGPGNALVRAGIGVYGLYPSTALGRTHAHLDLRPALTWKSRLAQVKALPARHPVGYGLTYITPRTMTIGIVPQGYSDGFDRGLSNSGEVLVGGRRCPVLGRVAMNMFAVDLTSVPDAEPEDEVVLLGAQGADRITAEEVAAKLGTIHYEVVARLSPLLPRRLV